MTRMLRIFADKIRADPRHPRPIQFPLGIHPVSLLKQPTMLFRQSYQPRPILVEHLQLNRKRLRRSLDWRAPPVLPVERA